MDKASSSSSSGNSSRVCNDSDCTGEGCCGEEVATLDDGAFEYEYGKMKFPIVKKQQSSQP